MDRESNLKAFLAGNHPDVPNVVYHGTGNKHEGVFKSPSFFTSDPQGAEWYAKNRGENPQIMPVHLSMKNPLDARSKDGIFKLIEIARRSGVHVDLKDHPNGWTFESNDISNHSPYEGDNPLDLLYIPKVRNALHQIGHDGVIASDVLSNDEIPTFIPLHPHQIKSATGNQGTFDPNNPDITKGDGGEVDGITAYHGSPYKFDKFNLNNSGSGFNAYGHGLYFTRDKNTAQNYKEEVALTTKKPLSQEAYKFLDEHIDSNTEPEDWLQAAINNAKKYSPHLLSEYENLNPKDLGMTTGHMYEVKIKAHPDHFLDYDESISKQSPHIKKSLQMLANSDLKNGGKLNNILEKSNEHDGSSIIDYLEQKYGGKEASKLLYQHGIKGTKYFDGGKQPWMDDSYHNYVVFDHNLVKIKRRYERGGSVEEGITAYHGSPHEFEQFDTSKIGTGEGAQAYGHGLYFAESEDVARSYRDALSDPTKKYIGNTEDTYRKLQEAGLPPEHAREMAYLAYEGGFDPETQSLNDFFSEDPHLQKYLKNPEVVETLHNYTRMPKPTMYEVHIDAHPDHFIDYNKSFRDQHPFVKERIHKAFAKKFGSNEIANETVNSDTHFEDMIAHSDMEMPEISKMFHDEGIQGVKYLDAGSRRESERGTRNYVVFDHNRVNIKRRYADGGEVEGYAKGGDTAIHKGRKFWSGVFDAHDGFIREVHPYKRAEASDFHHSYYVSPQSQDAMKQGDAGFFWVDPDGSINTHWRDDEAPKHIVDAIKSQIEPINKKDGGEVEAYGDGGFIPHGDPQRDENLSEFLSNNHPDVPHILYHGAALSPDKDISKFYGIREPKYRYSGLGGFTGIGTFLSSSPEIASSYPFSNALTDTRRVYPVHASIKNPKIYKKISDAVTDMNENYGGDHIKYVKDLMAKGFDGITYKEGPSYHPNKRGMQSPVWVVFRPTQIKSAIGNQGTFDPKDPDITKAEGGEVEREGFGFGGDTVGAGSRPERGATGSASAARAAREAPQPSYRDMPEHLQQAQRDLSFKNEQVINAMKEANAADKQHKAEQMTAWAGAGFPAGGPASMQVGEETRPTAYAMSDISKKSPVMQSQADIIASLAPPPQHYESSVAGNQIAVAPIPQHYESSIAGNQIAAALMPQHYESTFAQNRIDPAPQQVAFKQPARPISPTPVNKPIQLASLDSSTFKPASPMPDFQPQTQDRGPRRRLVKKLMPDGTYQDVWEEYAHGGVAKYHSNHHNPAIVEYALNKISAPPPALDPTLMVAKRGRPL